MEVRRRGLDLSLSMPRRHGRLSRSTALGVAAGVLLVYIANVPFYSGSTLGRGFGWRMEQGRLTVSRAPGRNPESFYVAANSAGLLRWSPAWRVGSRGHWSVTIPLYVPLALAAGWAIQAWRPGRAVPGVCRKCGYRVDGLPAGSPCPECGRRPAAAGTGAGPG